MNNNRSEQSEEPYFTIGVGNLPAGQNAEIDASLNVASQNVWRGEHNQRTLGGSAMLSSEQAPTANGPVAHSAEGITPIKPTPAPEEEKTSPEAAIGPDVIRLDGDNLGKGALDLIEGTERELSSTGDADEFVRAIDNMRKSLSQSLIGDKAA